MDVVSCINGNIPIKADSIHGSFFALDSPGTKFLPNEREWENTLNETLQALLRFDLYVNKRNELEYLFAIKLKSCGYVNFAVNMTKLYSWIPLFPHTEYRHLLSDNASSSVGLNRTPMKAIT